MSGATSPEVVRRLPDGSIDHAFHAARARRLRSAALWRCLARVAAAWRRARFGCAGLRFHKTDTTIC